jgi:hypothetical protein
MNTVMVNDSITINTMNNQVSPQLIEHKKRPPHTNNVEYVFLNLTKKSSNLFIYYILCSDWLFYWLWVQKSDILWL